MAMASAVMTKSALAATVAEACEVKMGVAKTMLEARKKPATKAGKREMFGKVVLVKAKPAKTVVKCFPAAAIKHPEFWRGPRAARCGRPWVSHESAAVRDY